MAQAEGVKGVSVKCSQLMEDLADITNWHGLGTKLGLESSQLDRIELEIPPGVDAIQRRVKRVLDTWMKRKTGDPSWRDVVSALMKMGEKSIAEEMRRKYSGSLLVSPVRSKDDDARKIARANECKLRGMFAELEQLVSTKLKSMCIDMEKFSYFVKYLFQPADCIPATGNIDETFLAIGRNELWDFMNYSHLEIIAKKFGRDDSELQQAFEEYDEAFAGYIVSTKVVHYFATQSHFSEDAYYSNTERTVARRDERYFVKLSMKLKARATEKSIQYLTELWEKFSKCLLLPTLPYLLDQIISGSIVVIWLIPPSIVPALIIKCMEPSAAELFTAYNICSLLVGNLVLYEEPVKESSFKQLSDSKELVHKEGSEDVSEEIKEQKQKECEHLVIQKESLQSQLQAMGRELEKMKDENNTLSAENSALRSHLEELRVTMARMSKPLVNPQQENLDTMATKPPLVKKPSHPPPPSKPLPPSSLPPAGPAHLQFPVSHGEPTPPMPPLQRFRRCALQIVNIENPPPLPSRNTKPTLPTACYPLSLPIH